LAALNLAFTSESLEKLKRFQFTNTLLSQVHKTGLGSSAAMITSLIAALFVHFDMPDSMLHNVAQFCHCLAQGKIGSGFDVCAALNGSLVYQRFSPCFIESHLNYDETKASLSTYQELTKSLETR
jgi:phosphomevalonate kinase